MTRIEKFKSIVERGQYNKVEGTRVDLFTAGAVVAVYENLNPTNREKFLALTVPRMCVVALKLVNRG